MFKRILLTAGSIVLMSATLSQAADPENTIQMQVSTGGNVTIELKPDLAPKHVAQIRKLTREGFYDGIVFHRVIDGFMAQTGDPTGTGTGGSAEPNIPAEFSQENFVRGTVGMARSSDPNSANSQFFICFDNCGFLNGQYTVFGQVTEGMEFVDKIARGEPPASPDKIIKMQVAADAGQPAAAIAVPPTATETAAPPPADAAPAEPSSGEPAPAEEAPASH